VARGWKDWCESRRCGILAPVSPPLDPLPILFALGWVVRVRGISREEGHEAITRAAWDGLDLTAEQQRALIRGVRAPDVSLAGLVTSVLPFAQRRHALRAWSGTPSATAVRDVRAFLASTHLRAFATPEGPRRWATIGGLLHCLQDSYSLAHADRDGGVILRMKHWGPFDGGRRPRSGDEHGFPSDRRDRPWRDGSLTMEARAAVEASRRYLEIAVAGSASRDEFAAFLDRYVQEVVPLVDARFGSPVGFP
jgi:hypothetical protein